MERAEHTQQKQRQARRPTFLTTLFVLTGVWLAVSPYVLGFSWNVAAWWNAVIIGIALVILGLVRFGSPEKFQGLRWTALILGAWMIASPFAAEYAEVTMAMWNAIFVGSLVVIISMIPMELPAGRRLEHG